MSSPLLGWVCRILGSIGPVPHFRENAKTTEQAVLISINAFPGRMYFLSCGSPTHYLWESATRFADNIWRFFVARGCRSMVGFACVVGIIYYPCAYLFLFSLSTPSDPPKPL